MFDQELYAKDVLPNLPDGVIGGSLWSCNINLQLACGKAVVWFISANTLFAWVRLTAQHPMNAPFVTTSLVDENGNAFATAPAGVDFSINETVPPHSSPGAGQAPRTTDVIPKGVKFGILYEIDPTYGDNAGMATLGMELRVTETDGPEYVPGSGGGGGASGFMVTPDGGVWELVPTGKTLSELAAERDTTVPDDTQ